MERVHEGLDPFVRWLTGAPVPPPDDAAEMEEIQTRLWARMALLALQAGVILRHQTPPTDPFAVQPGDLKQPFERNGGYPSDTYE